jgi:hypothetical protein
MSQSGDMLMAHKPGETKRAAKDETVVAFQPKQSPQDSETAFGKRWGTKLRAYGYTMLPSVLVHAQHRLGLTPMQFNILVQIIDCWWLTGNDRPRPSKAMIVSRSGIRPRTIQNNIRALEKKGYVKRIPRRSPYGDWHANEYDFSGLIAKLHDIEPELSAARESKRVQRRVAETPKGRRSRA